MRSVMRDMAMDTIAHTRLNERWISHRCLYVTEIVVNSHSHREQVERLRYKISLNTRLERLQSHIQDYGKDHIDQTQHYPSLH